MIIKPCNCAHAFQDARYKFTDPLDTEYLNCAHAFQDARYGAGNRAHNIGKSAVGQQAHICTLCAKRTVVSATKEKTK
jgi:hypothetical protein